MTLKVVRLKTGEDVIADIKETYNDKEQLVAYMLHDPYVVTHYLDEDDYPFDVTEDVDDQLKENNDGDLVLELDSSDTGLPDKPFAIEKVRLQFYPWCPLSSDKSLFIHYDWVVTAYEPYAEIREKYLELLKGLSDGEI